MVCPTLATAHRALQGKAAFANVRSIDLNEALKLLADGQLKQGNLEKKVDEKK